MITDIKITSLPVGIITDSHTDLTNLEKLKDKYNQIICLGDFTSTRKPLGWENDKSITALRKSGIPCLRGNHEQCIYNLKTSKFPLPFTYDISEENLDFIGNLPIGFRLILPNQNNLLCFHNKPDELGGRGLSPITDLQLMKEYPIDVSTTAVITGHNHMAWLKQFVNLGVEFIRCASLKDGGYAEIAKDGLVYLKNLNPIVEACSNWLKDLVVDVEEVDFKPY